MAQQETFTLSYEFNAPQELVFNAFGDADALNAWWGPVETNNTVIALDFKPGGIFHFQMDYNGHLSYGRFLFGRIEPHNLLEFSNAFADASGNAIDAPFEVSLPKEIFYQLLFTEKDGKTTIHLTGQPVDGSEAQIAGFLSIRESMEQGFGATFRKLATYLHPGVH